MDCGRGSAATPSLAGPALIGERGSFMETHTGRTTSRSRPRVSMWESTRTPNSGPTASIRSSPSWPVLYTTLWMATRPFGPGARTYSRPTLLPPEHGHLQPDHATGQTTEVELRLPGKGCTPRTMTSPDRDGGAGGRLSLTPGGAGCQGNTVLVHPARTRPAMTYLRRSAPSPPRTLKLRGLRTPGTGIL